MSHLIRNQNVVASHIGSKIGIPFYGFTQRLTQFQAFLTRMFRPYPRTRIQLFGQETIYPKPMAREVRRNRPTPPNTHAPVLLTYVLNGLPWNYLKWII